VKCRPSPSPRSDANTFVKVGDGEIDRLHAEADRLLALACGAPAEEFRECFSELVRHTEMHFQCEESLMAEIAFPHHAEHIAEHRQLLQELSLFGRREQMARAYVCERMGERLALHVSRMDSLLANCLRGARGG